MTTSAAVRRKQVYTVLLDGWIDGRLYAAGQRSSSSTAPSKDHERPDRRQAGAGRDNGSGGPAVVVPPSMNVPAEDAMAKLATAVADDQMAKSAAKKKPEDK